MRSDPGDDQPDLTTSEPVRWVDSSHGVRLPVHTLRHGDVPALLAHATGFHGRVWAPFAEHLDDLGAVAPDLRGHGRSEVPDGLTYDWDGFADDVLAVVDALGLERPVGIGHSKGGAALLRAEARQPGTFRAIWCFEPIVFPPAVATGRTAHHPLAEGALRRRPTFASYDEAIANYAAKPPMDAFDPAALEAYVRHGFAPTDDGQVTLRCRPEVEAEVYRMGTAHDTFDRLGEVRCPVVVAVGRQQPGTPAAVGALVADALAAGVLDPFDHLGHFGPLEAPAETAADAVALAHGT